MQSEDARLEFVWRSRPGEPGTGIQNNNHYGVEEKNKMGHARRLRSVIRLRKPSDYSIMLCFVGSYHLRLMASSFPEA